MSRTGPGEPQTGTRAPGSPPGEPTADVGGPLKTVLVAYGVGIAGFVVGFVLLIAGIIGLSVATTPGEEPPVVLLFLVQVVALQGIAFPLVALGYLRWRGLSLSYLRAGWPSLRDLGVAVLGLVGAFGAVVVALQVILELGLTPAQRGDAEVLTDPTVAAVGIPLMLLLVGPGEELLFRGVIQTTLAETFSVPTAIVLASTAFAPAHIVAYLGTGESAAAVALSLSVLFVPSLVFGAVYEYTDNLVVPALAHGTYNAVLLASILLGPQATGAVLVGV